MRSWLGGLLTCAVGVFVFGCSSSEGSAAGGASGAGGEGGAGGTIPAPPIGCDPLAPTYCAFPYPNDYFTVSDPSSVTGLRLALPEEAMPPNRSNQRSDPGAFNEMDGFSPGIAAMTHMPGATVTGLATPDTIEDSLALDSPTVILNADTGERVPHWVDRDEWVVEAKRRVDQDADRPRFDIPRPLEELQQEQALMLRPAVRLDDATRYIAVFRDVVDDDGQVLEPSEAFAALRDGEPSGDPVVESRRPRFEEVFEILEEAGIAREDLQLAWDFTTASRENNTQAMVHIRDDAFANYPDGVPYTIEVIDDTPMEGMACRLEITFDMPLYMTDGETGALLNLGEDGLPEQNGTYPYSAAMFVPTSAQSTPAPLVVVGHGQLGAKEQVFGYRELWADGNLIGFGLDHKGFSSDDIPTVVSAILGGDLSTFRAIPERMHQGHLNFLMAMRTLSREAEGGPTTLFNETLTNECGGASADGTRRYYFGGSQGGILGAVIMALGLDIERGLLAVPGQSYNLLLNRSVNFDEYAGQLYGNYGWNGLHMQMNLALIQGLWDRGEPTGYSKYLRTDRFENTPAHEVLIQVSKADHQVTNLGAHIMARTIGGVVNLAPLIRPVWGLEAKSGPHTGSGMLEIDFGNPNPPITNIPHWADTMRDPHGRATELAELGPALLRFYETGEVENPCNGPCDEDDLTP